RPRSTLFPYTTLFRSRGIRADLPVALVRWATTGRQETLTGTVENIAQRVAELGFEAPAVAVFGDVVSLRQNLNWYENQPLSGKRDRKSTRLNSSHQII